MTIIGIDPGAGGAMAVWNKGISKIYKCPKDTNNGRYSKRISLY